VGGANVFLRLTPPYSMSLTARQYYILVIRKRSFCPSLSSPLKLALQQIMHFPPVINL
jgi:hypothetical protein